MEKHVEQSQSGGLRDLWSPSQLRMFGSMELGHLPELHCTQIPSSRGSLGGGCTFRLCQMGPWTTDSALASIHLGCSELTLHGQVPSAPWRGIRGGTKEGHWLSSGGREAGCIVSTSMGTFVSAAETGECWSPGIISTWVLAWFFPGSQTQVSLHFPSWPRWAFHKCPESWEKLLKTTSLELCCFLVHPQSCEGRIS